MESASTTAGAALNNTRHAPTGAAMPDDFAHPLANSDAARAHVSGFAPSKQRDYLEWIIEARQDATRRVAWPRP